MFKRFAASVALLFSVIAMLVLIGQPVTAAPTGNTGCGTIPSTSTLYFQSKSGDIVYEQWRYGGTGKQVCWVVHDQYGRKANYIVIVTKINVCRDKVRVIERQFTRDLSVSDPNNKVGRCRIVDVQVWQDATRDKTKNYASYGKWRLNAA